jgi:hypothetical protein
MYRHGDLDWSDHYRLIGEFVVTFEQVVTWLRHQYFCLMQGEGLRVWELGTAVLNLPGVGPRDLAVIFCAGVHRLSVDESLHQRASVIVKAVGDLSEKRNEIVHGEWYVGPEVVILSDEEKLPDRHGIKRKSSKQGEKIVEQPTLKELESLVAHARSLRAEIQDIGMRVVVERHDAYMASQAPPG